MKKLSVALLAVAMISIQACDPKRDNPLDSYNRGEMLTDMYTNAIEPVHAGFVTEATELDAAAQAFAQAQTLPNLTALQEQWKATQQVWQVCEPMNVGDVRESFIHNSISKWPTSTTFIENFIAGTDEINEAFINSKGSTSKGFPALEYLIFGTNNNLVLQQLSADPRRVQYVTALAANIKTKAAETKALWASYKPTFTGSTGLAIDGSVNLLVNALIEYEEFIKNDKVGAPAGKKTNGVVQPTSVESALSDASMNHIINNLQGIDALLKGTASSDAGNGLYTYLDAVDPMADGTKLSDKLKSQITLCKTAAEAINTPLEEAVVNNPAQVETLYIELKKLTVLLKVEMTSILGVTITFTDNDGD